MCFARHRVISHDWVRFDCVPLSHFVWSRGRTHIGRNTYPPERFVAHRGFPQIGGTENITDFSSLFEDTESEDDIDLPTPDDPEQQTSGKVMIKLSDMDSPLWEHDLRADLEVINTLLVEMEKVSPSDDAKLQHLKAHILEKIAAPINPNNKKVLLFTAFADTADYCTSILRLLCVRS